MRCLAALLLTAIPAWADPPFTVGDHVVETQLFDMMTGEALPHPIPAAERACFRVEEISDTRLQLRLVSGYLDNRMPGMPPPPKSIDQPRYAPVGSGSSIGASGDIWGPCETPDPTGYRTVSTTCNMGRFYRLVADCAGRPIPKDNN